MFVLEGHADVTCLAYAPGGRMLASGGRDGAVCLWDPLAGTLLRTCRTNGLGGAVTSVAISPCGGVVAAGLNNGMVCTWHAGNGLSYLRCGHPGSGAAYQPAFGAFLPDGWRLATACGAVASLWRLNSDERLGGLQGDTHYFSPPAFTSLACGPEGQIALGRFNGVDFRGKVVAGFTGGINWPSGDVVALEFSPDGRSLAVARGRAVGLWTRREQGHNSRLKCARAFSHEEQVRACAFTAEGRMLLTAGDDWNVHLWDVATGEKRQSFNWRLGPVVALAVAPDGMTAAVAGRDRAGILIFDLE